MSDLTRLLDAAGDGDPEAAAGIFPAVYDELRRLAGAQMAREAAGHTLDPTALVHEAYLRLTDPAAPPRWEGRGHFFAAAAESMRRILVESARRKGRHKRGGGRRRVASLLGYTGLTAPFAGVVTRRAVSPGDFVGGTGRPGGVFRVVDGKAVRTTVELIRGDGQFTQVRRYKRPGSAEWADWAGSEAVASPAAACSDGLPVPTN